MLSQSMAFLFLEPATLGATLERRSVRYRTVQSPARRQARADVQTLAANADLIARPARVRRRSAARQGARRFGAGHDGVARRPRRAARGRVSQGARARRRQALRTASKR